MSDPDQNDEDKGFLARWSQRKQEAKQPEPQPDEPAAATEIPPALEADAAPEFDLSSLPKLEEMTGATDITGFLQKGVPEHLRNAALRQSWALDPAIRNYVNPALEYAYDWNTPGGVPGAGELGAGMDVARMVLQIMGDGPGDEPSPSAAAVEPEAERGDPEPNPGSPAAAPEGDLPVEALRQSDDEGLSAAKKNVGTEPHPPEDSPAAPQPPVRRHGTAKPVV